MSAFDAPGPDRAGDARRPGSRSAGDACLDATRAGKARLILIDEGVSPGTLKKFRDASEFHKVRMITLKAGQLAHSVGRPNRRTAVVQDAKLAEGILKGIGVDAGG